MNFSSSSSEENVFLANSQRQPVFKAASAVLPPPQPFGLGSAPGLPVPALPGLGFHSKTLQSFERGFDTGFEQLKSNAIPTHEQNQEFPVFDGRTNNVFGMLANNDPATMFMQVQRSLEFARNVDYGRVDGESNLIRGRAFGDLNNVEYEVRVFSVRGSSKQSYVEFNRWCGDGWEFSNFATRILSDLNETTPSAPQLPAIPDGYGLVIASVEDLAVLIEDIQEAPQDVAEHAAAELAMQTKNDVCKNLCDGIEGFCPRILNLLTESTNCAIVRSLLICLGNVAECDGLTKRIVSQNAQALGGIAQKWDAPQRMCGGLFTIAPSRQVTNCVRQLLMV